MTDLAALIRSEMEIADELIRDALLAAESEDHRAVLRGIRASVTRWLATGDGTDLISADMEILTALIHNPPHRLAPFLAEALVRVARAGAFGEAAAVAA
jgi:hypothetical protein